MLKSSTKRQLLEKWVTVGFFSLEIEKYGVVFAVYSIETRKLLFCL